MPRTPQSITKKDLHRIREAFDILLTIAEENYERYSSSDNILTVLDLYKELFD